LKQVYKKTLFKGSLPIFILAGVVLFLALILELLSFALFPETGTHITKAKMEKSRTIRKSENIFENIHKQYPSYEEALVTLKKHDVQFEPHNYVQGNYKSKVKVFVFNDNDCVICRQEQTRVLRQLKPYMEDILLVFKHMPARKNEESLSSTFGQMAIHKGVYDKFLEKLNNRNKPLNSPEDYFILLNEIGVDLSEIRKIMKSSMTQILKEVQDDVDMAMRVSAYNAKNQPVLYVNGYRLGSDFLPEHRLTVYLDRLLKGGNIVPQEGFEEDEEPQEDALLK
jgi:hypothetical protein